MSHRSEDRDDTGPQKIALITGANKGIGFAVAEGLGARGLRVGVGARDQSRRQDAVATLRDRGIDAFGVALDVTSEADVAAAARQIQDDHGRLDVLVNNAGVGGSLDAGAQDPTTMDLDVLAAVLETNVYGLIRVTNAMLPLLRRSTSPRVVNMSSDMGSLTLQTGPQLAAYAPSKTMVNSLTAQYARRLADTEIIVNAACPGLVATDFTGHSGERTPRQGATVAVQLATLPDDGPRGGFFNEHGPLPW